MAETLSMLRELLGERLTRPASDALPEPQLTKVKFIVPVVIGGQTVSEAENGARTRWSFRVDWQRRAVLVALELAHGGRASGWVPFENVSWIQRQTDERQPGGAPGARAA